MRIGKKIKSILCFLVLTGALCLLIPSLCVQASRLEGATEVTARIVASEAASTDSDITDSSGFDSNMPVASDTDENTFKTGNRFTFVFFLLVVLVFVISLIAVLNLKKYRE